MLQLLKINNFLLFKNQEVSFNGDFTAITGETGAGKSMLIKALRFVLGEKVDNLEAEKESSVIAQFELNNNHDLINEILNENDIELDQGSIILRRILGPGNKNKVFVNDVPVTLNFLKKLSNELVEFHSQHKQLEAFNQSNSLNIIDQFNSDNSLRTSVANLYQGITKLSLEIEEIIQEKSELEKDKDYIEHSFKEINALDLKENEETDLIEKKKLFNDKIKITNVIQELSTIFSEQDKVISKLIRIQREIIKLDLAQELEEKIEKTLSCINELESAADKKLREIGLEDNIENIEERLSKIKELARKYRCTSEQLLNISQEQQSKLQKLESINELIDSKTIEKEKLLKEYFNIAEKLSNMRKQSAKYLETKILEELKLLKLEQVDFKIELTKDAIRPIGIKGIDQAKFLIRTNQGFNFAQVNEVASGGELSRIMLAFKVALAQSNQKNTIIFDEIDTGTGGAVAQTIGNRMKKLAENNQIITISHQPQVTAKADQHLLVEKITDKTTQTKVKDLNREERVEEIARMLAGINVTETARQAAISLIDG
ncbi:MAG: DNA repair protein RecN [Rickettsiales bacterium]